VNLSCLHLESLTQATQLLLQDNRVNMPAGPLAAPTGHELYCAAGTDCIFWPDMEKNSNAMVEESDEQHRKLRLLLGAGGYTLGCEFGAMFLLQICACKPQCNPSGQVGGVYGADSSAKHTARRRPV
jgi:hypothetical protein